MFTDDKGILRVEALDSVSPLHTVLNTLMTSVSEALDEGAGSFFYEAANTTERNQLLAEHGAPIFVVRTDKDVVEFNLGSKWEVMLTEEALKSSYEVLGSDELFKSLVSGVSTGSASRAVIDTFANTCTLSFSVIGLSASSGTQRTEIGVLVDELEPSSAGPLTGYYTNGGVLGAMTGSGAISLRWSTASGTQQKYFSTSYVLA